MKKTKFIKYAAILFIVQSVAWALMALLCILCRTKVIERYNNGESYKDNLEDLFYILFMDDNKASSEVALTPTVFFTFCVIILTESMVWCIFSVFILHVRHIQHFRYFKLKLGWCIVGIIIIAIDVSLMAMAFQDLNYYGDLYINNPNVIVYYMVVYGILTTIAARGFLLLIINISFHVFYIKQLLNEFVLQN